MRSMGAAHMAAAPLLRVWRSKGSQQAGPLPGPRRLRPTPRLPHPAHLAVLARQPGAAGHPGHQRQHQQAAQHTGQDDDVVVHNLLLGGDHLDLRERAREREKV